MERFAIKINANVRSNLYNICRLCGMDYPDKVNIIQQDALKSVKADENDEPNLCNKIFQCVGIQISKFDKMPQSACILCQDKINDFFEFREMCWSADFQIRKLLGCSEQTDRILSVEESTLNTSNSTNANKKSTNKKTDSSPEEPNDSKSNEFSKRLISGKRKNDSNWDDPPSRKRKCIKSKISMKKKLKKQSPVNQGSVKNTNTLGLNGKRLKAKPLAESSVTTRRTVVEKSQREKKKLARNIENTMKLSPRKLRSRESRPSCNLNGDGNAIKTYVLRDKATRKSSNTLIKDGNKSSCPTCGKNFIIKTRLTKHIFMCSSNTKIHQFDEQQEAIDNKMEKIEIAQKGAENKFIAPASFVFIPSLSSINYKENLPAMENLYKTSIEVKKEPIYDCDTFRQSDEHIPRVKEEIIESQPCFTKSSVVNVHDETKGYNLKPALKLRIKKEHGTLNSCLIEQTDGGSYLYSPSKKKKQKATKPLRFEGFKQEDDSDVNINFACNITTVPFLQQNCFSTTHGYDDYDELGREPNAHEDVKLPVISTIISADGTTLSINTEGGVGKNISDVKIKSEFNINLSMAEQDKINCNFEEELVPKSEISEADSKSIDK